VSAKSFTTARFPHLENDQARISANVRSCPRKGTFPVRLGPLIFLDFYQAREIPFSMALIGIWLFKPGVG
jgi:hypothetical protein